MSTYGMTTSKCAGPKDAAHDWKPTPTTNGSSGTNSNGKA